MREVAKALYSKIRYGEKEEIREIGINAETSYINARECRVLE